MADWALLGGGFTKVLLVYILAEFSRCSLSVAGADSVRGNLFSERGGRCSIGKNRASCIHRLLCSYLHHQILIVVS